jgi:hypothetical protein
MILMRAAAFLTLTCLLVPPAVMALPGPSGIPVPVVRSSAPSKQIRILNKENPGGEVNIQASLVPNRTNVVVFFAEW